MHCITPTNALVFGSNTGTHNIDCVRYPLFLSIAGLNLSSLYASGIFTISNVSALVPTIPLPIGTRIGFNPSIILAHNSLPSRKNNVARSLPNNSLASVITCFKYMKYCFVSNSSCFFATFHFSACLITAITSPRFSVSKIFVLANEQNSRSNVSSSSVKFPSYLLIA